VGDLRDESETGEREQNRRTSSCTFSSANSSSSVFAFKNKPEITLLLKKCGSTIFTFKRTVSNQKTSINKQHEKCFFEFVNWKIKFSKGKNDKSSIIWRRKRTWTFKSVYKIVSSEFKRIKGGLSLETRSWFCYFWKINGVLDEFSKN